MRILKRFLSKILIIAMLSFSISASVANLYEVTVQAAVKAPSVTEPAKTLYIGYKTHKIKFKNKTYKATVTFKSGNTKVAKVSKSGTVTPVGEGKAVISAAVKQNNKTYSLKVDITVEKPYVSMTASTEYLNTGEAFVFKAKLIGAEGKVKWSVSDDAIAAINGGGKLTAKEAGKVTVYAEAGEYEASAKVIVGSNRLGTFSKNLSLYTKCLIYIVVSEPKEDETLYLKSASKSEDIVGYNWTYKDTENMLQVELTPVKAGTDTIIVTSDSSNDRLYIKVEVTEKPEDRKELPSEEIFRVCNPSMVEITSIITEENSSIGSGFFIDSSNIVTNYHVIEGAEKLIVKSNDGKVHEVEAILGYDEDLDLAILATDADKPSLVISQDVIATGETVYAIGSPFGLTDTFTKGMVTMASRPIDGVEYIQSDAAISPGNSGGPLLNKYGEVVGINTMYYKDGQNLNFSVSVNELYKINTNRPVSVKEFYESYWQEIADIIDKNTIYEDPEKSQNAYTSQEVLPYTLVKGSLKYDEEDDWYYINVLSPIYLSGIIDFENMEDMNVVITQIQSYKVEYWENAYHDKEEPKHIFTDIYLTPGYYFICLYKPDGYYGRDISYELMLGYTDA